MRIHILSDLHLEIQAYVPPRLDADLVVLAGDIDNGAAGIEWAKRTFDVPVLYLAGNHEYYDRDFNAAEAEMRAAAGGNVDLLDCGERIAGGVRFLACTLWTDYTLVGEAERAAIVEISRVMCPDYRAIRHGARGFGPEDSIGLCRAHRAWLERKLAEPFEGKTAVITHFAPHPGSIAPAFSNHPANPGFIVDLEHLMGTVPLWIHGHTHTAFDYTVRGTRVVCNPRGYPGEPTGFRPGWIVEL